MGISLIWNACSENDLKGYAGDSYIYFSKSADDSTEFSFAYDPEISVGNISLELNMISRIANYDRAFAVRFLPQESTAQEGRDFTYSAKDFVVKANDSLAYMKIEVKKSGSFTGRSLNAVFEILPNEYFLPGLSGNTKAKIVISDKLSRPEWWDAWHESNGLGTYSDKKYALFIKQMGIYDLTLKENGGKMSYYDMRGYVQLFKYWLIEHPQKEADGSDMKVPIIG